MADAGQARGVVVAIDCIQAGLRDSERARTGTLQGNRSGKLRHPRVILRRGPGRGLSASRSAAKAGARADPRLHDQRDTAAQSRHDRVARVRHPFQGPAGDGRTRRPCQQSADARSVLWRAKYEFWIPDKPERAIVYMADEQQHGVGFPTGIEVLIARVTGGPVKVAKKIDR
jgi:hypothetical protein